MTQVQTFGTQQQIEHTGTFGAQIDQTIGITPAQFGTASFVAS